MTLPSWRYLIGTCLLLTAVTPALAAEEKVEKKDEKASTSEDEAREPSVTKHIASIDGREIHYTATAGEMILKTDEGKEKAAIFYVAYIKDNAGPVDQRPITFCFNGGPGSSSVWLHLGMLGPKRVKLPEGPLPAAPPYELIDNPQSLLDVTDLVFIDPVSTGFSRPVEGEDEKQFHGFEQDLNSVAQFIHDFITEQNRWSSPKFLIGESYGGLRAAALSNRLQERYNIYLNGIVLVSAVIDFQTLAFSEANDLPNILFLPSYTAAAWYHKQLDAELLARPLAEVVAEAEKFAAGPYADALWLGDALPDDERKKIAAELARLTGLSQEYVENSELRISMWRFAKELLRDRKRTVGRFDSRYLGIDRDAAGESFDYDPSGSAVFGAFTATLNDYLRRELNYKNDRVYEILTSVQPWKYDKFTNRYVSASEMLRQAMTNNPFLKVYAACGYYDLATPYFAMDYSINHLGLAPEQRDNLKVGRYDGGHMMYTSLPELEKLRRELTEFYKSATDSSTDDAKAFDPAQVPKKAA